MTGEDEIASLTPLAVGSGYTLAAPHTDTIRFISGEKEVLVLSETGMEYMGQHVADAGEAHRAFMQTMQKMQNPMVAVPVGLVPQARPDREHLAELISVGIETFKHEQGALATAAAPGPNERLALHVAEFLIRNGWAQ